MTDRNTHPGVGNDHNPHDSPKPSRRKPVPKPEPTQLEFRYKLFSQNHPGDMQVRRSDWPKDAYKVIDHQSFVRFRTMLQRFDVPIIQETGDD